MADLCDVYTVAGLTLNAAAGDTYITDVIDGIDGAPMRRTVDPASQTDGGLVFPAFKGPRRITIEGTLLVRSVADPVSPAYLAVVNALEQNMVAALDAIFNADSTLAWQGGAQTLTVRRDETPTQFRGTLPLKRFLFSLIAANPNIA